MVTTSMPTDHSVASTIVQLVYEINFRYSLPEINQPILGCGLGVYLYMRASPYIWSMKLRNLSPLMMYIAEECALLPSEGLRSSDRNTEGNRKDNQAFTLRY